MRTPVPILGALVILVAAAILVFGVRPAVDELTGVTWHWDASTTSAPGGPSAVPDPSRYTIEFRPDRTFEATADCNAVAGTYRRIAPGRTGPETRLAITTEPIPLGRCGVGSLSEAYLQGLQAAASYRIVDGQLTIMLSDGGSMTFR